MKPTPHSFFSRVLHTLLSISLLFPTPLALAAEGGDMATTTLTGVTSALNSVNGFFNAYGTSNLQLQQLAGQLSRVQQNVNGVQTQQAQFDQINQQLSMAVVEAQNCVQKATRNYDKFSAKHPDAANISSDKLTSAEPTCMNYGKIIDAINTNKARMEDANKKMSCLMNLQNTVNQIAERAKTPFQSLTNSAVEVYKTHTQIIDAHKKISEKLDLDLNGKDGKGGYRERLGKLKQMALDLNNVLNAKKGEKDGLKVGLVKQVEDIKQLRTNAANKWYFTLMQDVEYCFQSEPAKCFANDYMLPPAQCLPAMAENEGKKSFSKGRQVRARQDAQGLQRIGLKNYMNAQKINTAANIDVSKPDEFLSFTRTRFDTTLSGVLGAYREHNFSLSLDKGGVTKFVSDAYNACYEKSVANFKSDMISKGGKYYNDVTAVKDAERETSNDLKNWIDRVEGEMSDFRTSFYKVYNSELAQFKTDCTAEEDPYKSLDCLRVLNATLESGIRGTRRATKLSNGSAFVSNAGETNIPIQTLTLDSAGKPSIGNSSLSCSGFDDCLSVMDRQMSQHQNAQQKGEDDRGKFVQQHNNAVKSAFDLVANQFGQMSQLLVAGVNGVNQDLAKIGIKASISTKQVEAEALQENKDTGLIDMPKSMKAALAHRSSFTEIEPPSDVTSAYNSLASDLNRKAVEAQRMKNRCQVTKGQYEALAGIMPNDCSSVKSVCSRDRAASGLGQMENLFRRSKTTLEDNEMKLSTNSEYNRCKSELLNEARDVTSSDISRAAGGRGKLYQNDKDGIERRNEGVYESAREDAIANKRQEASSRIRAECGDVIFPPLESLANQGRGELSGQNMKLVKLLRDVSDACSNVKFNSDTREMEDDNGDVADACEAFKSAAKTAIPPKGEEETKVSDDDGSTKEPSTNPLLFPGMAPAK